MPRRAVQRERWPARSAPACRGGRPIFAVQAYQQSLPFYLQRPVVLVDYRDEFDLGLTRDPHRGIATLRSSACMAGCEPRHAVMPPDTRDRLSALGCRCAKLRAFRTPDH